MPRDGILILLMVTKMQCVLNYFGGTVLGEQALVLLNQESPFLEVQGTVRGVIFLGVSLCPLLPFPFVHYSTSVFQVLFLINHRTRLKYISLLLGVFNGVMCFLKISEWNFSCFSPKKTVELFIDVFFCGVLFFFFVVFFEGECLVESFCNKV